MVKAIQVSDETYQKLESMGKKGDTFDMIVSSLLKNYFKLIELRDGNQE